MAKPGTAKRAALVRRGRGRNAGFARKVTANLLQGNKPRRATTVGRVANLIERGQVGQLTGLRGTGRRANRVGPGNTSTRRARKVTKAVAAAQRRAPKPRRR